MPQDYISKHQSQGSDLETGAWSNWRGLSRITGQLEIHSIDLLEKKSHGSERRNDIHGESPSRKTQEE